jgi:hypothetical protein
MWPVVRLISLHRGHKLIIAGDRFLTADNSLSYEDNTLSLKIKLESNITEVWLVMKNVKVSDNPVRVCVGGHL